MRINSKFALLLVLLFLLYILLFSSTNEEQTINYKELLPVNKIKEFLQANYYIGQWNKIEANQYSSNGGLQSYDGKFRLAVASRSLGERSIIFDDSKQNTKKNKEENLSNKTAPGWQVFILLFDSKYIDRHHYRFILRDGHIDKYNGSSMYSPLT